MFNSWAGLLTWPPAWVATGFVQQLPSVCGQASQRGKTGGNAQHLSSTADFLPCSGGVKEWALELIGWGFSHKWHLSSQARWGYQLSLSDRNSHWLVSLLWWLLREGMWSAIIWALIAISPVPFLSLLISGQIPQILPVNSVKRVLSGSPWKHPVMLGNVVVHLGFSFSTGKFMGWGGHLGAVLCSSEEEHCGQSEVFPHPMAQGSASVCPPVLGFSQWCPVCE